MLATRYRRVISWAVLLLLLLSLPVIQAQDSLEDQPLMKMLARIPNISQSRSELYFNDRQAVEAAYPPAQAPADWAAFMAMNEAEGDDPEWLPLDIWWRVWRNQASAFSAQYMMQAEETPAVMGFDYFQIEQEMTYGTPPAQAMQLAGRFDLDAVRAAYTARGYAVQPGEALEYWCPEAGCDAGTQLNIRDRNPANLFGGQLGRSQPLIIDQGVLVSSSDETVMSEHLNVAAGQEQSLADLPQYRAAAAAMTADGSLLQAYFWDGELLVQMGTFSPAAMFGPSVSAEVIKRVLQDMLKDYETLPPYQLLGFADVASDTEQMGEVVLVYANEADAKIAAEVLPKRIANYQSIALKRSFVELLNARGVGEPVIKLVDYEGMVAVVVAFATPKATVEQLQTFDITNFEPAEATPPGLVYKLLVDSALRRDINWLNTIPKAELEAALQ